MLTPFSIQNYFNGRKLAIATMHGKEQVIAPILERKLNVRVSVPEGFDTDDFGTFSGEIGREKGPLDTARRKCQAAHEITGASLVLASEGSFGGHPVIGFVPADEELLLLRDFERNVEFRAKLLSTRTNFAGNFYDDWDQVLFFSSQVSFPSHALILRPAKDDYTELHKGINTWDRLKQSFHYFRNRYGRAWVETDMRAMHNPTRMKVIAEATEKLIEVLYSACPACSGPGFAVQEVVRGLPCAQCLTPTQSAKAVVYHCPHCAHQETRKAPSQKEHEDPMYCDACNP